MLIAAGIDFIISAYVAQQLSDLEPYLNTTVTLVVDFVTYFSVFISLFLFDNRKKYKINPENTDWPLVKSDLKKILSSVGIGEVAYLSSRWFFQFHFLLRYATSPIPTEDKIFFKSDFTKNQSVFSEFDLYFFLLSNKKSEMKMEK